ncbi:hypothetical protein D3C72_621070 [compost metagenome]
MTPTELDDALDAMQLTAAGNPDLMPGLITVESNHWVQILSAIRPTCARLDDGLRHRDVQIHVGSAQEMKVLTREAAGERDAPYRDVMPRP